MEPNPDAVVLAAERVGQRVVITFDDGKAAVFSAPTLYAAIAIADEVMDETKPAEN